MLDHEAHMQTCRTYGDTTQISRIGNPSLADAAEVLQWLRRVITRDGALLTAYGQRRFWGSLLVLAGGLGMLFGVGFLIPALRETEALPWVVLALAVGLFLFLGGARLRGDTRAEVKDALRHGAKFSAHVAADGALEQSSVDPHR